MIVFIISLENSLFILWDLYIKSQAILIREHGRKAWLSKYSRQPQTASVWVICCQVESRNLLQPTRNHRLFLPASLLRNKLVLKLSYTIRSASGMLP